MVQTQPSAVIKNKQAGKRHWPLVKIDMTPMVDLGFLLITFFIITTTLAEQKGTNFYIPKEGTPTNIGTSHVLTVLLDAEDQVFIYEGDWKEAETANAIYRTDYHVTKGLSAFIQSKQIKMGRQKNELMLLIKPTNESTYNNLINALDEVLIHEVKRYAIIAPTPEESDYLSKHQSAL